MASLRSALTSLDPDLPLYNLSTMRELVTNELRPWRVVSRLIGACSIVALLLSALGLYGVIAFAVAQRRREIGVRMAIGARPRTVLAMVLADAIKLVLVSALIGTLLSGVLTQTIRHLLYQVAPWDPFAFTGALLLLVLVALLAALIPARAAAHLDPVIALRIG
jgi:ABC-type antimicrobial peptide transport system permease subunit